MIEPTEALEAELRALSEKMDACKTRFQKIRVELRDRRMFNVEQTTPEELTAEQQRDRELTALRTKVNELSDALTRKVITMEAEQGALAVEAAISRAEAEKAQQRFMLIGQQKRDVDNRVKSAFDKIIVRVTAPDIADAERDALIEIGLDLRPDWMAPPKK